MNSKNSVSLVRRRDAYEGNSSGLKKNNEQTIIVLIIVTYIKLEITENTANTKELNWK